MKSCHVEFWRSARVLVITVMTSCLLGVGNRSEPWGIMAIIRYFVAMFNELPAKLPLARKRWPVRCCQSRSLVDLLFCIYKTIVLNFCCARGVPLLFSAHNQGSAGSMTRALS